MNDAEQLKEFRQQRDSDRLCSTAARVLEIADRLEAEVDRVKLKLATTNLAIETSPELWPVAIERAEKAEAAVVHWQELYRTELRRSLSQPSIGPDERDLIRWALQSYVRQLSQEEGRQKARDLADKFEPLESARSLVGEGITKPDGLEVEHSNTEDGGTVVTIENAARGWSLLIAAHPDTDAAYWSARGPLHFGGKAHGPVQSSRESLIFDDTELLNIRLALGERIAEYNGAPTYGLQKESLALAAKILARIDKALGVPYDGLPSTTGRDEP